MADILVPVGSGITKRFRDMGDGTWAEVTAAGSIGGSIGTVDTELPAALLLADAFANPTAPSIGSHQMRYNGATWDRYYNNATGTLLASAARTADTPSPDQINYNARGVLLTLSITAITGTGIRVVMQFKDPISGNYVTSATAGIVTPTAYVAATGTFSYFYYPATSQAALLTQTVSTGLPRLWRALVQTQDGLSATYSLAYSYAQ